MIRIVSLEKKYSGHGSILLSTSMCDVTEHAYLYAIGGVCYVLLCNYFRRRLTDNVSKTIPFIYVMT